MTGLCKTGCGYDIEYEPHEFSDGFVYYLPRNVDGTVHDCFMVGEIMVNVYFACADDNEDVLEKIFQENKDKLKISLDEFLKKNYDSDHDPLNYLMDEPVSMDFGLMSMVMEGRMFELKKQIELQINMVTIPSYQHRITDVEICALTQPGLTSFENKITESFVNASNNDVCMHITIDLPTNKGYQLEYLGKYYELMIRLEDAKECYQLQYESTKESEFLDAIKKLDEKILEINTLKTIQNTTKNISFVDTEKLVTQTELDTREFILKIFNSNLSQVWKLLPKIKKNVDSKRAKQEDGLIDIDEKSPLDYTTLGELVQIIRICNPKTHSPFNDSCKKCNKTWEQYDNIFLIETPSQIKCVDSDCFMSQGGIIKKTVKKDLFYNLKEISRYRNNYTDAHPKKADEAQLSILKDKIAATCKLVKIQYDKINYI